MQDLEITSDNNTPFYVEKELTTTNAVTDEKHVADQTKKIANSPGMLEKMMRMPHIQQKIVEHLTGVDVEKLHATNQSLREHILSVNQMLAALQGGQISDRLAGEYSRLVTTYFNAVLEQKLTSQDIAALKETQINEIALNRYFFELKTTTHSAISYQPTGITECFSELSKTMMNYCADHALQDDDIHICITQQIKKDGAGINEILFLHQDVFPAVEQFFAVAQHFFDTTEKDEHRAVIAFTVAKLINYLVNQSSDNLNAEWLGEVSQPYATLEAIGHAIYWHLARPAVENNVSLQ